MTFLVLSDVHAEFDALARVAQRGEPLVILGDLVNLIDHRTTEGIIPDVVGTETVERLAALRRHGRRDEARTVWRERTAAIGFDVSAEIRRLMVGQYERMATALEGARSYVTYGNADDPELLREYLPKGSTFVDGDIVEIDGLQIGIAGGGLARIGSSGEVSDDAMRAKLESIGRVDVIGTHVPPSIGEMSEDVVAGTTKGSEPILDYLERHQPAFHYFGDVHQPRALRWVHGGTVCRNVGYFRATGRPWRHDVDAAS